MEYTLNISGSKGFASEAWPKSSDVLNNFTAFTVLQVRGLAEYRSLRKFKAIVFKKIDSLLSISARNACVIPPFPMKSI